MRKEGSLYKSLYNSAFIAGIVVTGMLVGGSYWYGEIKNLYLLPLSYVFSMMLVKNYYYHNKMGIAVSIIELTKFARYIILPLVYVLSDQIMAYDGTDLNSGYHEKAVILMSYEMLAVSVLMYIYYIKRYKGKIDIQPSPVVNYKPGQTVYLFALVWLAIVLLIGSYRNSLLNFGLQVNKSLVTSGNVSNNILDIVFQFGKIYIFSILLYFASTVKDSSGKVFLIIIASLFFVSSSWSGDGFSISRWGLIVSVLSVLYAFYCFFPQKKNTVISVGLILVSFLIGLSTFFKMSILWSYGNMSVNETALNVFSPDQFDNYFEGVYNVSNGLATYDLYGDVIGFQNFLTELFYHFPFSVRIFDLYGHTWAEYYYKLGVEDLSLICPSLIQSYYYFGSLGCPIFSCFAVFLALWLTDLLKKENIFTVRLLLVYAIFWLSLFNCINYTIVEAHIWFSFFGILICRFDKSSKMGKNMVFHKKHNYYM